jgi:GntR family transcriptional regulator/MocR family aminotransferase
MTSIRTTSPELLIELDRSRPRGLRAQVEDELRDAIRSGRLAPGTSLPSSRALAADLGVTRGVVVAAYDQLTAEGYLVAHQGSGTVVNANAHGAASRAPRRADRAPVAVDFRPGLPDLDLFPRSAWLRATRDALQAMPRDDLGYIDPRGLPQLRQALADYLARVRGVSADPERVVVCDGFGHGLSLVAGVLRTTGHDVVAVEDPGYDGARDALAFAGVRHCGVAVDDDGLVVDELRGTGARAVVLTPAHQNPTGAVMSPARRTAAVAWARDVDGYVIEDDYDAEYRYDRHPAGAIQGLDTDRVIYCGTTSKSLAPGLRLGWLVLPGELVEPIVAARRATDSATSSFLQATYAAFLSRGDLDRHLRRTRRIYRQRRDALIAALARWFPDAVPRGASAGLQLLVNLPSELDEQAFVALALQAGARAYPLGTYRASARPDLGPGLLLGYGALTPAASEEGARLLGETATRPEARATSAPA